MIKSIDLLFPAPFQAPKLQLVNSITMTDRRTNELTDPRTNGGKERGTKSCVSATKYEQGFYPDEATSSFLLPAPIETMQQIRNYGIVSERKFDQGWIHNYFGCAMDEQGQHEKTPVNSFVMNQRM